MDQLSQLFRQGLDVSEELKVTSLSTNDKQFQTRVAEGIKVLEECTRMVNELSLFSSNESVEEIATKNLKFLLLPALLADLTLKSQITDRSEVLETAEIYFKDFIQRLNDYQICDIDLKQSDDSEVSAEPKGSGNHSMAALESAVHNRNQKIQRFKEGKEMDNKLREFREKMAECDANEDSDDEFFRNYYLTLIKRWINSSLEELNGIAMERPMIEHMKQVKGQHQNEHQDGDGLRRRPFANKESKQKLKPIIITRDQFQKKVYGLGYPSIPTVSIDDFVSQKIEEGSLAITDPNIYSNSLLDWAENPDKKRLEDESEDYRKEKLVEEDDADTLRRVREMDDYKDVHKRGEGNRKNMG